MNAFQLRLELIKLAKEMIEQEYHSKRETVLNNWQVSTENARTQGQNLPNQPDFPPFPSEEEVIKKAQTLNGFVSGPSSDLPQPVVVKGNKRG